MKSPPKNCADGPPVESLPPRSPGIRLVVVTGDNVPSKKNRHYASPDGHIRMDTKIKKRMKLLEGRILSALLSLCLAQKNVAMDLACLKQLRTRLSSLSDDSLREISEHSWNVRYVEPGFEGVEIEITPI